MEINLLEINQSYLESFCKQCYRCAALISIKNRFYIITQKSFQCSRNNSQSFRQNVKYENTFYGIINLQYILKQLTF